jgi:glycosyltransferase involved in cell wall biosynthesis
LIRNGVDVARFRPDRNPQLRTMLGAAEDDLLCGYVGHLRPEKQLDLLVRAFAEARIPNGRLALVGEGCCRTELERLSRDLGIADRIVFTGHAVDTIPYYAAFDIFLMSSLTEQMPMSLLEAMACGLPALCTDVGDTRDMLGGGGPPVVVPLGALAEYVNCLRNLTGHPELRASLGEGNRKRCEALFSQERMAREFAAEFCAAVSPSLCHA